MDLLRSSPLPHTPHAPSSCGLELYPPARHNLSVKSMSCSNFSLVKPPVAACGGKNEPFLIFRESCVYEQYHDHDHHINNDNYDTDDNDDDDDDDDDDEDQDKDDEDDEDDEDEDEDEDEDDADADAGGGGGGGEDEGWEEVVLSASMPGLLGSMVDPFPRSSAVSRSKRYI